ncbi:hypothetical protein MINTM021_17620 [Mycobacterium paraintracellulare]|nr:hypothetical protein MINTM021_17620 [Mycobacterium paraintracellulare]
MLDNTVTALPSLDPILGEIARRWYRLHPRDLTAAEAFELLHVLGIITDRIDAEQRDAQVIELTRQETE